MNKKRLLSTKWVTLLVSMSIGLSTTTFYPSRAEAAVGVAFFNPILIVSGALLLGEGTVLTSLASRMAFWNWYLNRDSGKAALGLGIAGIVSVGLGIILLDEKPGMVQFSEISGPLSEKWGISTEEKNAFNKELATINAISENVYADLQNLQNPTVEMSFELWKKYGEGVLSKNAMMTLAKFGGAFKAE